jgi:hypothetical protein
MQLSHFYPLNFSSKMDTLKALLSLSMDDDERKADPTIALLNKVSDLGDFRNTMVHAYWRIEPDGTTTAVRFPTRGGKFSRSLKPLTSTEIRAKATEAGATEQLLRGLRNHLLEHRGKTLELKEHFDDGNLQPSITKEPNERSSPFVSLPFKRS